MADKKATSILIEDVDWVVSKIIAGLALGSLVKDGVTVGELKAVIKYWLTSSNGKAEID